MKEESLQIGISRYLSLAYPSVIFTAESSGIKLTIGQAKKAQKMRSSKSLPDMLIFEPRGGYHGLMIELKREGTRLYLKDGSLSKAEHIQAQNKKLLELRKRGYYAVFAVGFDEARGVIDKYMKLPLVAQRIHSEIIDTLLKDIDNEN